MLDQRSARKRADGDLHELVDFRIDEISVVDFAANELATIAFAKRRPVPEDAAVLKITTGGATDATSLASSQNGLDPTMVENSRTALMTAVGEYEHVNGRHEGEAATQTDEQWWRAQLEGEPPTAPIRTTLRSLGVPHMTYESSFGYVPDVQRTEGDATVIEVEDNRGNAQDEADAARLERLSREAMASAEALRSASREIEARRADAPAPPESAPERVIRGYPDEPTLKIAKGTIRRLRETIDRLNRSSMVAEIRKADEFRDPDREVEDDDEDDKRERPGNSGGDFLMKRRGTLSLDPVERARQRNRERRIRDEADAEVRKQLKIEAFEAECADVAKMRADNAAAAASNEKAACIFAKYEARREFIQTGGPFAEQYLEQLERCVQLWPKEFNDGVFDIRKALNAEQARLYARLIKERL